MMTTRKREITKEMYDRAKNGILADEDKWEVFSQAELCGYGVYGTYVIEEDGKYYTRYWLGSTCD